MEKKFPQAFAFLLGFEKGLVGRDAQAPKGVDFHAFDVGWDMGRNQEWKRAWNSIHAAANENFKEFLSSDDSDVVQVWY